MTPCAILAKRPTGRRDSFPGCESACATSGMAHLMGAYGVGAGRRANMPAATTLKLTGTIVGLASGSQTVDVAYTNATAPDVRLRLDVPDAGLVKFDIPVGAKFVIITLPLGNVNAISFGHDPMNLIGPDGTAIIPL